MDISINIFSIQFSISISGNVEYYSQILQSFSEAWMNIEMDHKVSKAASEAFWEAGAKWFPRLQGAKVNEVIETPIPQFVSLRNKMYINKVPPIELEFGYRNRETNEIIVRKCESAPVKEFNNRQYEKLYESASVKVKLYKWYCNYNFHSKYLNSPM